MTVYFTLVLYMSSKWPACSRLTLVEKSEISVENSEENSIENLVENSIENSQENW